MYIELFMTTQKDFTFVEEKDSMELYTRHLTNGK